MSKPQNNKPPIQGAPSSRIFGPPALFVQVNDDLSFLTDPGGFIMERAEWLALRAALDAFYLKITDAEIAAHNQERLGGRGARS